MLNNRIGKVILLGIMFIMITTSTCCGGSESIGEELSVEEVITNVLAASSELNYYRLEVQSTAEVDSSQLEGIVSIDYSCIADEDNKAMAMNMSFNADMTSTQYGTMQTENDLEIYLVDNILYTKIVGQAQESPWEMEDAPDDFWDVNALVGRVYSYNIQIIIPKLLSLLENREVELLGSERTNGINCYALQVEVNSGDLLDALELQLMRLFMGTPPTANMVESASLKLWVAKDSFFLTKADIRIDAGESGAQYSITSHMSTFDHNEIISIELPDEATSAP